VGWVGLRPSNFPPEVVSEQETPIELQYFFGGLIPPDVAGTKKEQK